MGEPGNYRVYSKERATLEHATARNLKFKPNHRRLSLLYLFAQKTLNHIVPVLPCITSLLDPRTVVHLFLSHLIMSLCCGTKFFARAQAFEEPFCDAARKKAHKVTTQTFCFFIFLCLFVFVSFFYQFSLVLESLIPIDQDSTICFLLHPKP